METLVQYFQKLYRYNRWANLQTAESLLTVWQDPYIAETFSHAINAQYIWMARIQGTKSPYTVRQIHAFEDLPALIETTTIQWKAYLQTLDEAELARVIAYTNSFGESFESSIADIIPHAVNHASYHRGQVNRALRLAGGEPVNTDFISYCRMGLDKVD